jgi:hypothetical protein
MTFEEREECQVLVGSSGVGQGKVAFLIGRVLQSMEFLNTQG